MAELTEKQKRFVAEYLIDLNATQAAIRAGYSPKAANREGARQLSNVDIQAAISEAQARVAEKAEWSAAERLASLKAIHDASLTDDRRTAISAISEANKMQGSYAPSKQELTGKGGGPVVVADLTRLKGMSDKELEILERALVQIGIAEGDKERAGEPEE